MKTRTTNEESSQSVSNDFYESHTSWETSLQKRREELVQAVIGEGGLAVFDSQTIEKFKNDRQQDGSYKLNNTDSILIANIKSLINLLNSIEKVGVQMFKSVATFMESEGTWQGLSSISNLIYTAGKNYTDVSTLCTDISNLTYIVSELNKIVSGLPNYGEGYLSLLSNLNKAVMLDVEPVIRYFQNMNANNDANIVAEKNKLNEASDQLNETFKKKGLFKHKKKPVQSAAMATTEHLENTIAQLQASMQEVIKKRFHIEPQQKTQLYDISQLQNNEAKAYVHIANSVVRFNNSIKKIKGIISMKEVSPLQILKELSHALKELRHIDQKAIKNMTEIEWNEILSNALKELKNVLLLTVRYAETMECRLGLKEAVLQVQLDKVCLSFEKMATKMNVAAGDKHPYWATRLAARQIELESARNRYDKLHQLKEQMQRTKINVDTPLKVLLELSNALKAFSTPKTYYYEYALKTMIEKKTGLDQLNKQITEYENKIVRMSKNTNEDPVALQNTLSQLKKLYATRNEMLTYLDDLASDKKVNNNAVISYKRNQEHSHLPGSIDYQHNIPLTAKDLVTNDMEKNAIQSIHQLIEGASHQYNKMQNRVNDATNEVEIQITNELNKSTPQQEINKQTSRINPHKNKLDLARAEIKSKLQSQENSLLKGSRLINAIQAIEPHALYKADLKKLRNLKNSLEAADPVGASALIKRLEQAIEMRCGLEEIRGKFEDQQKKMTGPIIQREQLNARLISSDREYKHKYPDPGLIVAYQEQLDLLHHSISVNNDALVILERIMNKFEDNEIISEHEITYLKDNCSLTEEEESNIRNNNANKPSTSYLPSMNILSYLGMPTTAKIDSGLFIKIRQLQQQRRETLQQLRNDVIPIKKYCDHQENFSSQIKKLKKDIIALDSKISVLEIEANNTHVVIEEIEHKLNNPSVNIDDVIVSKPQITTYQSTNMLELDNEKRAAIQCVSDQLVNTVLSHFKITVPRELPTTKAPLVLNSLDEENTQLVNRLNNQQQSVVNTTIQAMQDNFLGMCKKFIDVDLLNDQQIKPENTLLVKNIKSMLIVMTRVDKLMSLVNAQISNLTTAQSTFQQMTSGISGISAISQLPHLYQQLIIECKELQFYLAKLQSSFPNFNPVMQVNPGDSLDKLSQLDSVSKLQNLVSFISDNKDTNVSSGKDSMSTFILNYMSFASDYLKSLPSIIQGFDLSAAHSIDFTSSFNQVNESKTTTFLSKLSTADNTIKMIDDFVQSKPENIRPKKDHKLYVITNDLKKDKSNKELYGAVQVANILMRLQNATDSFIKIADNKTFAGLATTSKNLIDAYMDFNRLYTSFAPEMANLSIDAKEILNESFRQIHSVAINLYIHIRLSEAKLGINLEEITTEIGQILKSLEQTAKAQGLTLTDQYPYHHQMITALNNELIQSNNLHREMNTEYAKMTDLIDKITRSTVSFAEVVALQKLIVKHLPPSAMVKVSTQLTKYIEQSTGLDKLQDNINKLSTKIPELEKQLREYESKQISIENQIETQKLQFRQVEDFLYRYKNPSTTNQNFNLQELQFIYALSPPIKNVNNFDQFCNLVCNNQLDTELLNTKLMYIDKKLAALNKENDVLMAERIPTKSADLAVEYEKIRVYQQIRENIIHRINTFNDQSVLFKYANNQIQEESIYPARLNLDQKLLQATNLAMKHEVDTSAKAISLMKDELKNEELLARIENTAKQSHQTPSTTVIMHTLQPNHQPLKKRDVTNEVKTAKSGVTSPVVEPKKPARQPVANDQQYNASTYKEEHIKRKH